MFMQASTDRAYPSWCGLCHSLRLHLRGLQRFSRVQRGGASQQDRALQLQPMSEQLHEVGTYSQRERQRERDRERQE